MNCLAEAFERQGNSVELLFKEDVPGFSFHRRLSDFLFPFFVVSAMKKVWEQKGRSDVVALHSLAGAWYVFLRQIFKSLPPCVIVSYGADEMRWELELEEERLGLRKVRLFSKIFYYNLVIRQARYATRHADHVMVTARCEIDYFEKKYGVPRNRITFIPNGVTPDYFAARLPVYPPYRLLYLGGWEWRKGIRYLAEAFSLLAEEHSGLTLSLVGIGVDPSTAKKEFPEKYHERISVIPKVTAPETVRIYENHDVFIFPSLFESMSLVVPEAMASGMAVVTTRACGMQDIIEHGREGLLAAPRDSRQLASHVNRLLKEPGLAQKLGQAAQIKARELLWDNIAKDLHSMYAAVLSGEAGK